MTELQEIVEKINSKEVQKKDIAKELGINPSTLQRRLKKEGYTFDKETDLWIMPDSAVQNPEIQEEKKQDNKEYRKKVINPSSNKENKESKKPIEQEERKTVKKVTYEIEEGLHDELKIKAIREKRNVSEIVSEFIKKGLGEA